MNLKTQLPGYWCQVNSFDFYTIAFVNEEEFVMVDMFTGKQKLRQDLSLLDEDYLENFIKLDENIVENPDKKENIEKLFDDELDFVHEEFYKEYFKRSQIKSNIKTLNSEIP